MAWQQLFGRRHILGFVPSGQLPSQVLKVGQRDRPERFIAETGHPPRAALPLAYLLPRWT
jgi:hypothetical protein